MRKTATAALLGMCVSGGELSLSSRVYAQSDNAFRFFRYDEDWSAYEDSALHTDVWNQLKHIPVTDEGYLSFGGSVMGRYEFYDPLGFGGAPTSDTDGYFYHRAFFHTDFHVNDSIRVFGELKSVVVYDREPPVRGVDEDALDVHQAFIDLSTSLGSNKATLRLGRQEIGFGKGRMFGVKADTVVRLSHQAASLGIEGSNWRADAFFSRSVGWGIGTFDNGLEDERFWGLYYTHKQPLYGERGGFDVYYFGNDRPEDLRPNAFRDEVRHSIGSRIYGVTCGFSYDIEAAVQFGDADGEDIGAWFIGGEIQQALGSNFSVGALTGVFSGDSDPDSGTRKTFSPPITRSTEMGDYGLFGPSNLVTVSPFVEWSPSRGLSIRADLGAYWRLNENDDLYTITQARFRSGDASNARFVGVQPGVRLKWQVNDRLGVDVFYRHFEPGDFIEETGPSDASDFIRASVLWRF